MERNQIQKLKDRKTKRRIESHANRKLGELEDYAVFCTVLHCPDLSSHSLTSKAKE